MKRLYKRGQKATLREMEKKNELKYIFFKFSCNFANLSWTKKFAKSQLN